MNIVSFSELRVFRMFVELSTTVVILTSEGRVGSMVLSFCLTLLMRLTVLAPDCFWMAIIADLSPLVKDSWDFSSRPSMTVATSLR